MAKEEFAGQRLVHLIGDGKEGLLKRLACAHDTGHGLKRVGKLDLELVEAPLAPVVDVKHRQQGADSAGGEAQPRVARQRAGKRSEDDAQGQRPAQRAPGGQRQPRLADHALETLAPARAFLRSLGGIKARRLVVLEQRGFADAVALIFAKFRIQPRIQTSASASPEVAGKASTIP